MDITGKEIMIFAKEFDGKMRYRAGLSRKKQDGSYDKAYIDVKLPKNAQVENKTKIDIIQGFLSFYKTKGGNPIWYIVVQQFATSIEAKKEQKKEDPYANFGKQTEVYEVKDVSGEQLDLPF